MRKEGIIIRSIRRTAVLCAVFLCTAAAALLTAGAFSAAAVYAEEPAASGKWGDLTWTFDADTGTLAFEGEGDFPDNRDELEQFEPLLSQIKTISFGEGITQLGAFYLDHLTQPLSLILPSSLTDGSGGFFFNNGNSNLINDIQVAEDSSYYEVRDGALIDKKNGGLACLPACVVQESYTLPDDLTRIDMMALHNTRVRKLILHDHVKTVSGLTWGRDNNGGDGVLGELKEVWLYTAQAPGTDNWLSVNENLTVHIPKDGLGYDTSVWSRCTLIRDLEGGVDQAELSGQCGENVFWNCTRDGVLTITGSGPMYDYSADDPYNGSVRWNGLSSISDGRFIREIHIGEGITHIGSWAFYHFAAVTDADIPGSVTSIGSNAFSSCFDLQKVTMSDNVERIDDWAFFCTDLEELRLPANLKTIPEGICKSCLYLTKVTLPAGLTEIGKEAFYGCETLPELVIPDKVEKIGDRAFTHCYKLKTLLFEGPMPELSDSLFEESEPRIDIDGRYYYDSGTWHDPNDYDGFITWQGNCLEHRWQDDEVLKEATWEDEGLMRQVCPQCGGTREIVIPKKDPPEITPEIILSIREFIYDGRAHRPEITVKDQDGNELREIQDYVIEWPQDQTSAGDHTAIVRFVGRYRAAAPAQAVWTIGVRPTQILDIIDGDDITVSWERCAEADGYILQYSSYEDKDFANPVTVRVNSHDVTETSFAKPEESASSYYLRICTYKAHGDGELTSSWDTMEFENGIYGRLDGSASAPPAPTLLAAYHGIKIKLEWTRVARAERYYCRCAAESGTVIVKPRRGTINLSYRVPGLKPNTWYGCTVVAKDADGRKSPDSNGFWALTAPRAPRKLAVTPSKGKMSLSWRKSPGAVKYRVYYCKTKNGKYRKAATVTDRRAAIRNKKFGLKKGRRYYFRVRAVNEFGSAGRRCAAVSARAR